MHCYIRLICCFFSISFASHIVHIGLVFLDVFYFFHFVFPVPIPSIFSLCVAFFVFNFLSSVVLVCLLAVFPVLSVPLSVTIFSIAVSCFDIVFATLFALTFPIHLFILCPLCSPATHFGLSIVPTGFEISYRVICQLSFFSIVHYHRHFLPVHGFFSFSIVCLYGLASCFVCWFM